MAAEAPPPLLSTVLRCPHSFHLVRIDRCGSSGGGVAIALRSNINSHLLPSYQLKLLEAVGVEVSTTVVPITIIGAYCPKQDLEEGDYTILCLDAPTRLNRSGVHSILDVFLTNMPNNISKPVVHQNLSSDHFPVVAEVGNYHRIDWGRFQRCVDDNVDYEVHPQTPEDIDRQLHNIKAAISLAREQHVPKSRPAVPTHWSACFEKRYKSLCWKPLWKFTKILKTKSRSIPPLRPLDITSSVDRLIPPAEKAAEQGQHFISSHNIGQDIVSPHEAVINEHASNLHLIPNNFSEELEITADELTAYIKTSKTMKAPGFDNILNLELKNFWH
ncbi:uncharacterized protein LOC134290228 [Aedes albopictus]|uniref:Endonuclease/exonuclease/phosphatase domain-containing protein n=1 Tax=Aedes albopictus TaxID=7160 RepID=A0ABM1ZHX8_AEDAL